LDWHNLHQNSDQLSFFLTKINFLSISLFFYCFFFVSLHNQITPKVCWPSKKKDVNCCYSKHLLIVMYFYLDLDVYFYLALQWIWHVQLLLFLFQVWEESLKKRRKAIASFYRILENWGIKIDGHKKLFLSRFMLP